MGGYNVLKPAYLPFTTALLFSSQLCYAGLAEDMGIKTIEEALAIGTLMSDSDALAIGFINFDLKFTDGFGDKETLDLKNSLDVLVLPYTWQLAPKSKAWDHAFTLRAGLIKIQRSHDSSSFTAENGLDGEITEFTFDIFANYSQHYYVNEQWYVESAVGLHLSYYENTYQYGADVPEEIKEELDQNLLNVTTLALILEPKIGIGYEKQQSWGSWRLHNSTNYIYGQGLGGTIKDPGSINPEGWRFTNGVEFNVDVPELWGVHDFLSVDFKRIDLIGDMRDISEKGYYYETSFGWIIDTNNAIPMLDNIGVGLSVNYGSSISGGTIVLYFNQ